MQFQSKYNAIFIRTSQNESKEYSGKEEKKSTTNTATVWVVWNYYTRYQNVVKHSND